MAASMRRRRLFMTEDEADTSERKSPKVNWRGPGVYKEDGEELTFVGKDFPTETKGRSMYRKLFTNPADQ